MKVGTDGVLLGAWAPCEGATRILDAGTGTGLIALMLAQRQPDASIVAIDIDEASWREAADNFSASPWSNRFSAHHCSLQQFASRSNDTFDLIVSNPPYFSRSLPAKNPKRTLSRHNDLLGASDLILAAKELMTQGGTLALILPVSEYASFFEIAELKGLYEHRKMVVYPVPGKPAHRIMSCWGLAPAAVCTNESLIIEEGGRHQYSAEYLALTRAFYLNIF